MYFSQWRALSGRRSSADIGRTKGQAGVRKEGAPRVWGEYGLGIVFLFSNIDDDS